MLGREALVDAVELSRLAYLATKPLFVNESGPEEAVFGTPNANGPSVVSR